MDRLLTVLIQTSPVPSHPSTALLEALFRSFDRVDGLREARIVILCDGCEAVGQAGDGDEAPPTLQASPSSSAQRPSEVENLKHGRVASDKVARYQEHLRILRERIEHPPFASPLQRGTGTVELLVLRRRHGSARAIHAAFFEHNVVRTPFVIVGQHDNFFVADVPLRDVITALQAQPHGVGPPAAPPPVQSVHFVSTSTRDYVRKARKRYGLELTPRRDIPGMPHALVPLVFWYGRTQLARTAYYTEFVLRRPLGVGDHLEELLGEAQLREMREHGTAAHARWGNYLLDQGVEVLYHLSGRRALAAPVPEAGSGGIPDAVPAETSTPARASSSLKPLESCYTTARSARAIVPGLYIPPPPPKRKCPDGAGAGGSTAIPSGGKRFRQQCFHCGEKGHSFKFCPKADAPVATETIDLSGGGGVGGATPE